MRSSILLPWAFTQYIYHCLAKGTSSIRRSRIILREQAGKLSEPHTLHYLIRRRCWWYQRASSRPTREMSKHRQSKMNGGSVLGSGGCPAADTATGSAATGPRCLHPSPMPGPSPSPSSSPISDDSVVDAASDLDQASSSSDSSYNICGWYIIAVWDDSPVTSSGVYIFRVGKPSCRSRPTREAELWIYI